MFAYHPQVQGHVRCSRAMPCRATEPGGNDESQRARPGGSPQLPPRPPEEAPEPPNTTCADRSSSRGRGGCRLQGTQRGLLPPPPPPPSNERLLASAIAYSGMLGTIACAAAQAAHIDAWGNWHWDVHDTAVALAIVAPAMVLNAALIVPDYSNWRLPDAEVLVAMHERQPRSATGETSSSAALVPTADAAGNAANGASPSGRLSSLGVLPASQWGRQQSQTTQRQLPRWQRWKDACHLAQGMLLASSSPAVSLNPALGAIVLGLDALAVELLYRSVLLQLLGGWMTDR